MPPALDALLRERYAAQYAEEKPQGVGGVGEATDGHHSRVNDLASTFEGAMPRAMGKPNC